MAAVRYGLAMPEPHRHLFEVTVRCEAGPGPLDLVLPSWTPGSYLLREFPRHVQDFRVHGLDGLPLAWRKRDKGTWRVEVADAGPVTAHYRVYANELSVRTSHLDATHGSVNGASVFMFVRGRESEPLEVEVDAPAGWRTTTSLAALAEHRFRAADYDELVDSPLEIGTHEVIAWEQDGLPHRYAIWGRGGYAEERLVADTRRIIDAARDLFGSLPYERYTFILHLFPGGRGGLEHRSSCSLQAERWAFEGEEYERFLSLVAHEFYHVWNAKRIRPEPLGPFDYTAENYTRNLWVVEGITTYYTDLILRRAGIITVERYLARQAEAIQRLQALPGRHVQSLEESSFDTWIKFYRPDENTPNAQVSYYEKGALVALLLDLRIRAATGGERSLDDVMRLLWERYGAADTGFPEDPALGIRAAAEEVGGESLEEFFADYVHGTRELDYDRYLDAVGLRLDTAPPARPAGAAGQEHALGVRTREEGGRLRITHVLADTPAARAGLDAGDELLALDGLRLAPAELPARLRERALGATVELTLFRRDELLTLPVTLDQAAPPRLRLCPVPGAGARQEAAFRRWLGAPPPAAKPAAGT